MRLAPLFLMCLISGFTCAAEPALAAGGAHLELNSSESLTSIFSSELATELAQADTVPGSGRNALPQLAFGGGWYSALYFSNPTTAAATLTVNFFAGDGTALSVPLVGIGPVTTHTLTLNPNATAILEAPNSGVLQQGWAEAVLPAGVTGYGVFRQSAAGRSDQEAVVPLSPEGKQSALLTWDETLFTTGVAVVNPSATTATVSVSVFGDDGAAIGTSTINLVANGKTAFNLRDLPGLAGVTAKRGLAQFTVTSGAVAVLGLRFGGSAFTSIPVTYP